MKCFVWLGALLKNAPSKAHGPASKMSAPSTCVPPLVFRHYNTLYIDSGSPLLNSFFKSSSFHRYSHNFSREGRTLIDLLDILTLGRLVMAVTPIIERDTIGRSTQRLH